MPTYVNDSDGARMVHFGAGDIGVALAKSGNELVLLDQPECRPIGELTTAWSGDISTDALPPGHRAVVRLVFDGPDALASLNVVREELDKLAKRMRPLSNTEEDEQPW